MLKILKAGRNSQKIRRRHSVSIAIQLLLSYMYSGCGNYDRLRFNRTNDHIARTLNA